MRMTVQRTQLRNSILQFLRHASISEKQLGSRSYSSGTIRQRVINERAVAFRPAMGKGPTLSQGPLKARYEPSSIFGVVQPRAREVLQKPVRQSKSKSSVPETNDKVSSISEKDRQVFLITF
jgi:hypothetical protein